MFESVNVFQMVVSMLILVGVVIIFMRQNNTCVMKQNEVEEGFVLSHYNNKRVGRMANYVISGYKDSPHYIANLHRVMKRFGLEGQRTNDEYKNYCITRHALGGCEKDRKDCADECGIGKG